MKVVMTLFAPVLVLFFSSLSYADECCKPRVPTFVPIISELTLSFNSNEQTGTSVAIDVSQYAEVVVYVVSSNNPNIGGCSGFSSNLTAKFRPTASNRFGTVGFFNFENGSRFQVNGSHLQFKLTGYDSRCLTTASKTIHVAGVKY
jgi:hypothetical protein